MVLLGKHIHYYLRSRPVSGNKLFIMRHIL